MVLIRALGRLEVVDDAGAMIELGGRQPRVMLAVLLAAGGRPVTVDALVGAVWGDTAPGSAVATLQSYVSRLRRSLGESVGLRFDDAGYRLDVSPDAVDVWRFERLADAGRVALEAGRADEARTALLEADSLWRGPAWVEIADIDAGRGVATRLEERRLLAMEDRLAADLLLGRHTGAVGELAALVEVHPLREKLREQLAIALYRSGRQAEALRAIADAGRVLREELGIEPSRPLRELEARILNHDPTLDYVAQRAEPAASTPPPAHRPPPAGPSPADAAASAPRSTSTTLVGRIDELAELVAALDESTTSARFAVIEGEPGIGKTRLADELRAVAEARGARAVWGRSDEGGAAPALWPWLPILRTIASSVGEMPTALAELLAGQVPVLAGQADAQQYERFDAVAKVLTTAAATAPLVILLDDVQWADAASLELLAFLSGQLDRGVLVVATLRQMEVGRSDAVTDALGTIGRRPGSRRIHLRGLSRAQTAAVLDSMTAYPVPDDVADAVHARAEGNPFYAIELARLLAEEGGPGNEVPGNVGDVIRRRLRRLPPATVDLLGAAAVVGRDVPLELLAQVGDISLDACVDQLEPAVAHRLLVAVPEHLAVLRFNHALVREVLLADLTSLRRARLHLRVADAIEAAGADVDDAEILAEHLWQAAPIGVGRRAAEAIERAAEVALRRVAYAAAEDLLTKAVQLRRAAGNGPADQEAELDTLTRLLEVGRARRYFQAAVRREVLERAMELAERCGRRDTLIDLLWFEVAAMQTAARREEAGRLVHPFRAHTEADLRPDVQAIGVETYAVWLWGGGRIADAVTEIDRAMALFQQAPPPTTPFAAEAYLVTVMFWLYNHAAHGDRGAAETFADFERQLADSSDRQASASICGFAATTALVLGEWAHAERFATRGLEIDAGSNFAFWGAQALMQLAAAEAVRGDVDRAVQRFAEGRKRYLDVDGGSGLPMFGASVAMNVAAQGRVEEAIPLLEDAQTFLRARRELWNEPIVLIAEGEIALAGGDSTTAANRFGHAASVAAEQGAHAIARRAQRLAADRRLTQSA